MPLLAPLLACMLVPRRDLLRLAGGAAVVLTAVAACSTDDARPPYWGGDSMGGGGPAGPGSGPGIELPPDCEGPPSPDTAVLCGEQVVSVVVQKPALYFVVDISGSMAEPLLDVDADPDEV